MSFYPHTATVTVRTDDIDLAFTAGTAAPGLGAVVTGGTSAAHGVVSVITVTSGTWAGHDAAGTLRLTSVIGTFTPGEALTGAPAGAATAGATTLVAGSLGTRTVSWSTLTASQPCRFYNADTPAIVLSSGEVVRQAPKCRFPVAVTPHSYRIVSTVPGHTGTFEVVAAPARLGPFGTVDCYECELKAVAA